MTKPKFRIDDHVGEKIRKRIEEKISKNTHEDKKRQILDFSSGILELELESEEEALYLIYSMSYTLGSVAFEISQFSLAFMLETASRSAAQELTLTLEE
jgi:hypothetical protein